MVVWKTRVVELLLLLLFLVRAAGKRLLIPSLVQCLFRLPAAAAAAGWAIYSGLCGASCCTLRSTGTKRMFPYVRRQSSIQVPRVCIDTDIAGAHV